MTKDIPIIFSGPMVRALLEGRKTMTRRIFEPSKQPPPRWDGRFGFSCLTPERHVELRGVDPEKGPLSRFMPMRYWKGDRLWVRETWCPANSDNGPVLLTRADHGRRYLVDESSPVDYDKFPAGNGAWCAWAGDVEAEEETKAWRPSIHMPRWASRLTLIVEGIKVEPLQHISEEDALAEGICAFHSGSVRMFGVRVEGGYSHAGLSAREAFTSLWCDLHGPSAWNENPFVVAISFRVIKANIDAPEAKVAA